MEIIELPEPQTHDSQSVPTFQSQVVSDFGNLLVQEAAQLGTSFGFEPSVRFSNGRLSLNRFLITVTCDAMGTDRCQWLDGFMRRTAMPMDWWAEIEQSIPTAAFIHFGFEEGQDDLLYKFYLEHTIQARTNGYAAGQSVPLYTGYKWSVVRPDRQYVTDYRWYPDIPWTDVWNRLQELLNPGHLANESASSPAWELIESLWPSLIASDDWTPRLTEVTEACSPRRSYDLNVYDATVQLQDLRSMILQLGRRFDIGEEHVESWLCTCPTRLLGHIAAGRQRNGSDFVTLYYGAQSYDA